FYLGDFVLVVFPQLRTRFTSNPGASAGLFAVDQLEKNVAEIDPSMTVSTQAKVGDGTIKI
ncbi:MAG: hypothetical protein AB7F64_09165, partial [Gammaproteobacteria bacterium]